MPFEAYSYPEDVSEDRFYFLLGIVSITHKLEREYQYATISAECKYLDYINTISLNIFGSNVFSFKVQSKRKPDVIVDGWTIHENTKVKVKNR